MPNPPEPRYTEEQIREGLLSEGALIAAASKHRYWDLLHANSRMTKAELVKEEVRPIIEAALYHFTQQPVGVGADPQTKPSAEAGGVNSP